MYYLKGSTREKGKRKLKKDEKLLNFSIAKLCVCVCVGGGGHVWLTSWKAMIINLFPNYAF